MTNSEALHTETRALIAGLLLVGLAFALPVAAGEGRRHHGSGHSGDWIERHADELGIDEATLAEIEQIVDSTREEGKALRKEHRAARDAMRELLDQDQPNIDAVMEQAEVVGEIDVRKHKHRIATMLEIRAKLTPDQRSQLRELKGELHERRGKHRKHGRHHRGDRDRDWKDDAGSDEL